MSNKRYTNEFKQEVIRLALSRNETKQQLCDRLNMSYSTLCKWMKKYQVDDEFKDKEAMSPKEQAKEIKRLKRDLAKAKQVEEILKKATAYFAKET